MIQSLLSKTEAEQVVAESGRSPVVAELMKKLFFGGGISIGAAVVFGALEVLRNDPHEAIPLLQSWGWRSVFDIFVVFAIYDITKMVINIAKRGVIALEGLTAGVQQIAGKDDRQLQEIQTLTAYTSQESERNSTSLKDLHGKVDKLADSIAALVKEKSS